MMIQLLSGRKISHHFRCQKAMIQSAMRKLPSKRLLAPEVVGNFPATHPDHHNNSPDEADCSVCETVDKKCEFLIGLDNYITLNSDVKIEAAMQLVDRMQNA